MGSQSWRKRLDCSHWIAISDIGEDKSFADDFYKEPGIVSSRVALLLRSAEIKPIGSIDLFFMNNDPSPLQYLVKVRWAGRV